jgi:hypothetical protein
MHRFLLPLNCLTPKAIVLAESRSLNYSARRLSNANYGLAQTITALAPPSQLAPLVPSTCKAAPPAQ